MPEIADEWNRAASDIRNYFESDGQGPVALIVEGNETDLEQAGRVPTNHLMTGMMDPCGQKWTYPETDDKPRPQM